jgi:hypothetical protein
VAPLDDSSALAAFNTRFRALAEEKDAKERDGKAARKAAGKATLKKMIAERTERITTRKASNREGEAAAEREMLDSLNGESWGRVVSLVDIHGHTAAASPAAAAAEKKGKAAGASSSGDHAKDGAIGDTTRFKDALISLKAKPLATHA